MALADIIAKILSEVEEQASLLREQTQKTVQELHEKAREEIEEESAVLLEKGNRKIEELHQKIDQLSRQEQQQKILSLKHEVLHKVLEEAKNHVAKLPEKEKEAILTQMLRELPQEKGIIHPVTSDAKLIETILKKEGISLSLGKAVPGMAGFLFSSDTVEIDFRFEQVLEDIFRKSEKELSLFLFA